MKNIQIPNLNLISNSINLDILEHGHLHTDKKWHFDNITSPFNRLYFILNGDGYIQNHTHRIALKKGFMYLIPCNTSYDYRCDKEMEKFYIHFNLEYLGTYDLFDRYPSCDFREIDKLTLHNLILDANSDEFMDILKFKIALMNLITLFHNPNFDITSASLETTLKYKDVFKFIQNNCLAHITTSDIADYVNLNKHTLSKNFKKDLGLTLKQYLTLKIIEKAKQDLLCTNLNIKEVAFGLGFNDEFYFSRFFKKHVGFSPTQYRLSNSFYNVKH